MSHYTCNTTCCFFPLHFSYLISDLDFFNCHLFFYLICLSLVEYHFNIFSKLTIHCPIESLFCTVSASIDSLTNKALPYLSLFCIHFTRLPNTVLFITLLYTFNSDSFTTLPNTVLLLYRIYFDRSTNISNSA